MAEACFYLRKGSKQNHLHITEKQPIYVSCRIGSDQLVYPTGFKVLPKYWDFDKTKIKNVLAVENKDSINKYLADLKNFIDNKIEIAKTEREPIVKAELKKAIDIYLDPTKGQTITFFEFIESFIDDCKTGKRRVNDKMLVAKQTIKNYGTGLNGLKEFEKHTGEPITFKSLNKKFWQEYINYLQMKKKYMVNTVGAYQKYLIVFLRECKKEKVWSDPDGLLDIVKTMTENPIDVYLNKTEIAKIEALDLLNNERLSKVRDLFLVGLNTGFRVSDWHQIKLENIKETEKGNPYLEIIQTKTKGIASTSLRPIVKSIIEKYENNLPIISDQKINKYLKELCKLAKINEKIKVTTNIAGFQQVDFFEKHEMVSSHTGRRSFATNCYRDGVKVEIIMKATGHTTEKNFRKYLKLDNSDFMDMQAEHEK